MRFAAELRCQANTIGRPAFSQEDAPGTVVDAGGGAAEKGRGVRNGSRFVLPAGATLQAKPPTRGRECFEARLLIDAQKSGHRGSYGGRGAFCVSSSRILSPR